MIITYRNKSRKRWCTNCMEPMSCDQGVNFKQVTSEKYTHSNSIALCDNCMALLAAELQRTISEHKFTEEE